MKKSSKKISEFLHNPWFVGAVFYFLGFISPRVISNVELIFLKKETSVTNISNVKFMTVDFENGYFGNSFSLFLFVFLVVLGVVIIVDYYSEN